MLNSVLDVEIKCLWTIQVEILYRQWEEALEGGWACVREVEEDKNLCLCSLLDLVSSPCHKAQGCVLLFINLFFVEQNDFSAFWPDKIFLACEDVWVCHILTVYKSFKNCFY